MTTFSDATVTEIVDRLERARISKEQIRQLTLDHPGMTVGDAYRVQQAWIDRRVSEGRSIIGHKIGLTSRAMQQSVGINEPDFGALLDDMVFDPSKPIPTSRFVEPRIEVELAFVLANDLHGIDLTADDVFDATAYVTPALEIIDARVQRFDPETGRARKVMDTIADNAANAGIIMGGRQVDPGAVDLPWVGAFLEQNGVIEETGLAAGVQGNPVVGVIWLANRYAELGIPLKAGHVILAGSFTRPIFIHPGDHIVADYGPLGRIEFRAE